MSGLRMGARWLGGLLLAAAQGALAAAQMPQTPAAPPPFHRVYIPSEQLHKGKWSEGYLPIEAAEFRRLLETAHANAIGAPSARAAHIEQAEFTAQLVGDDLLVGSGTLQWSPASGAPSLAMVHPFSPALRGATWRDQSSKAATLGTAPDGKLGVLVEGSQLHCDWSLRGERTASGAVGFRLELPDCPVTHLVLEAPANFDILAEGAIIAKSPGSSAKTARWTIELGGQTRVLLRAISDAAARERRPLTLLRQAQTYEFSPRGVNVETQLKLDIHGEPIQRLAVNLDPSLRLVAARYGELQVPWSATIDVESRVSHIELQLPEAVTGTGRVLQLSAIAPLTIGKRWRLPGLQGERVSWQEGTATLLIPDSLVLEQLSFDGCRQSRAQALPAPTMGESIEVQFYRPGAAIEVLLAQPRPQLKVDSGSLVEVGANEFTSHCALALSLPRGERRVAQTRVNPGWAIDGVENPVSGRSVEWEIDDSSSGTSQLKIRLDDPITVQSATRLIVRGHRTLPSSQAFEARQFEMLAFDDWHTGTRLISVRAAEGSQLRWTGAVDLTRLDPLELSPAQLELFPRPPNGLVFADDAVFAQSVVALDRRRASYAAEIRVDAVVQNDVLTETCILQCTPEAARLDRLLVRLSQARPGAVEWNLAGGNSGQLSARKMSPGEQAQTGLPSGGEAWEIGLRLLRPGPFELRAVRSTPFKDEMHVALAAVADATTQKGTLTIRASGFSGMAIKNRRLASVPAELLEADRYQTARGTYRYQPLRDDLGDEPAVSIAPAKPAQAESGAWVWTSRLESRYAADAAVHWATFCIQTAGRQQLTGSLPEGAKLQAIWVDGQALAVAPDAADSPLNIDLPFGRSLATVSLYYTTPGGLPRLATAVEAPLATLDDLPMMARTWVVWLPADYEIADTPSSFPTDSVRSLTLSERLFGGLGRNVLSRIFNPFSAQDWQEQFSVGGDKQAALAAVEQFVPNLGTVMTDYLAGDAESDLTWGQLLSTSAEAKSKSRRTVLIDNQGLAAIGLTPQTRVRFQPGDSPRDRGLGLLKQAGLTVIGHASALVVTSTANAAAYARELSAVEHPVMFTAASGSLVEQLKRAMQGGDSARFIPAAVWPTAPEPGPAPWSLPEARHQSIQDVSTWSAYTWHLTATGSPRIRIVRSSAMGSLAWALFLGAVAIGVWRSGRRPIAVVSITSLAAAAAVWMPAAYAPLASAIVLGGVVCLLARITRIPPGRTIEVPTRQSRSSRRRVAVVEHGVMVLAIGSVLSAGAALVAAPPTVPATQAAAPQQQPPSPATEPPPATAEAKATEPDSKKRPPYRVFVPVDAEQKPVGSKYYVPKEFYDELHRQAAVARGQKPWLVTQALYQGVLSRDPVTKQLGLSQLKASLDVQVFQANVQIELPLPRDAAANVIVGARIEGRPVPLRWNAASVEFLSGPLAAGRYRLELSLQPPLQTEVATAGFDLPIPPIANASLRLSIPADAPSIELPIARGQAGVHRDRGELTAQLGACSRLAVRWPVGIGTESNAPNLEVEEFVWMRVRPGTTILDAKFKYRILDGKVRQIRLLTDPRLRLLPSINTQSPIVVHTLPGDPQRIDLDLSRTSSKQVVVDLSFLLTGTSSVGNLRLPRLESSGARAVKRWLAVSVDPALEYKDQLGEDSRTVSIADFSAAWGGTDTRPHAAYSIPRGEPMWVLATQPIEPRTTAEQTLAVSLARGSSQLRFDASLAIAGGYLFQLTLDAPKNLNIERVTLLEDGQERVARSSTDENGRVIVFLTTPITGRQRLSLHGRVDSVARESAAVPQVKLVGVDIKKNLWQLFRQPNLMAEVEPGPAVVAVEPTDFATPEEFGSLVGCYQSEDSKAMLRVKTSLNVPRAKAVAVTALEHDAGRWTAELEYHVEVLEGVVDVLQFEIPPSWSEPQVEPPARMKLVPIPGEARRQLIVYPPEPIGDKYLLKIRGRVALSPGDRLRVPDIVPQRVDELERFVVVPQHLDRQQVAWETTGLTAAELPVDLTVSRRGAQSSAVYQVSGEHFQASIKAVRRPHSPARVKLADVHLAWHPEGHWRGVALFDLESPAADRCLLELPEGCHLLHVSVEGLPAQIVGVDANHWRVGLGPQQLPQRLEVIYAATSSPSGGRWLFQAPRLADMEVEKTLWTVYSPAQFTGTRAQQAAQIVPAANQSLSRIEAISALVQLPAEIVGEHLPEELLRWYQPWKKRYAHARASLDRQLAPAVQSGSEPQEASAARRLDQLVAGVDARIGLTTVNARQLPSAATSPDLLAFAARDLTRLHYQVRGPSPELELQFGRSTSNSWWGRVLGGLAVILLGALAVGFLRDHQLPELAPWLVIGGIGAAWWLLLAPSVVGLPLLLVAGWLALTARRHAQSRLLPN